MFTNIHTLSTTRVLTCAYLIIRRVRFLAAVVVPILAALAIPLVLATLQSPAGPKQQSATTVPRPAIEFELDQPSSLAISEDEILYVSTFRDSRRIKRLDLKTGLMSALTPDVATSGIGSLAIDAGGKLLAGDTADCRIIQIDPTDGATQALAGSRKDGIWKPGCGSEGDQGPAFKASLEPNFLSMDPQGNLFILDEGRHGTIRRIDMQSKIITSVVPSYRLRDPEGLAVDKDGRVFVAQARGGPDAVLAIDPSTGSIAPLKKNNFTGNRDLWKRSSQRRRLLCDPSGNLYASDDARVYYINFHTHNVSIVAGTTKGFSGDGGLAIKAQFYMPGSMVLDSAGNLYIADTENQRIRRVDAKTHIITTIAGNGLPRHIPGTIEVSE